MATTKTAEYYPVVVEKELNGTWSAYVAGVPGVYAAADSEGDAKKAIRSALRAHLRALRQHHRSIRPNAKLAVLKCDDADALTLRFTGVGSLLGRKTSVAKARAARENGRKGGRPRLHAHVEFDKPRS